MSLRLVVVEGLLTRSSSSGAMWNDGIGEFGSLASWSGIFIVWLRNIALSKSDHGDWFVS